MFRIRSLSSLAWVLAGAVALSACGGGRHSSALPPSAANAAIPPGAIGTTTATFTFTFPKSTGSSNKRRAQYVSQAMQSLTFKVDKVLLHGTATDITANEPAATTSIQSFNFSGGVGQDGSQVGQCGTDPANAGNYRCTATFLVPFGDVDVTLITRDAQQTGGCAGTATCGNILSENKATGLWVKQSVANTFSVSLDGNAGTITLNGSQPCQNGTVGSVFGSVGTTTVNFSAVFSDPAGKTIVKPGLPVISILGNDSAYHTDNGTINATGGTVTFTIDQSTQSFTLTPSTVPISGASVTVKGTPASGSDGLSFSVTHTFTFSAGTAPPTSAFLAVVEQTGANSGQVDFYQMTLGGSGGPDTFAAYATAPHLAVTNSNGGGGPPDVDNPLQLAWDTNGDLLIANGGTTTGGDVGNLACVPIGAIATGANTSTTTTADVNDPTSMAYNPTNGNVAFADTGSSATYDYSEYTLSGNYTEVTAARINDGSCNSTGVTSLPTLTAGTFAVSFVCPNGASVETDSGHTASPAHAKVEIVFPNGTTTTIQDDQSATNFAMDDTQAVAWDSANSQMVVANHSSFHKTVSFYTVSPVAQEKVISTSQRNFMLATSTDGHVAVAGLSASGSGQPKILIYSNASGATLPTLVKAIPFNYTATQCGSDYAYGTANVRSMTWLSNTKLLVGLQSNVAAKQGLYIFDISATATPTGYGDESTCPAEPVGGTPLAAQSGFQQFNNVVYGTAYKP
jgi:hypothetical protein